MQAIIKPGLPSGTIDIPPSKSMLQRACACALLYKGRTFVAHPGSSEDEQAAISIIQQLGATVDCINENTIEITHSDSNEVADTINCRESGLAARLFTPIAALQSNEITISGTGSLMHRPMNIYYDLLPDLGVTIQSKDGRLPLTVKGPLQPNNITLDGSTSSQFVSGLLIAYAFAAREEVSIKVSNLNSKPYVDLTLQMLNYFGRTVAHDNYEQFTITPQQGDDHPDVYISIEGDWSAATNFHVAKALDADVKLNNLNEDSLQADKAIAEVVNDNNEAFNFDATHSPDLIPALAIYATQCTGESTVKGMNRLIHKESNRIESITAMLQALGAVYSLQDDVLSITGKQELKSGTIDARNDHRIVMAAAIAGTVANGPVTINGAEAVKKSYPDFFSALTDAGVDCQLVP